MNGIISYTHKIINGKDILVGDDGSMLDMSIYDYDPELKRQKIELTLLRGGY